MQEKTESDMLNSESKSELSFRVNGWRQKAYSGSPLELKSDIKGIEIRTLADFCSKLNELNGISENPFFLSWSQQFKLYPDSWNHANWNEK